MSKRKEPGRYDIGYRKPPSATQFKAGQSGNPSGRPKGSVNPRQMLLRIAKERVTVTERGKQRRITRLELAAKQLWNKAVQGDLRAVDMLMEYMPTDEAITNMPALSVEDAAILKNLFKSTSPSTPKPKSRRRAKRRKS